MYSAQAKAQIFTLKYAQVLLHIKQTHGCQGKENDLWQEKTTLRMSETSLHNLQFAIYSLPFKIW